MASAGGTGAATDTASGGRCLSSFGRGGGKVVAVSAELSTAADGAAGGRWSSCVRRGAGRLVAVSADLVNAAQARLADGGGVARWWPFRWSRAPPPAGRPEAGARRGWGGGVARWWP